MQAYFISHVDATQRNVRSEYPHFVTWLSTFVKLICISAHTFQVDREWQIICTQITHRKGRKYSCDTIMLVLQGQRSYMEAVTGGECGDATGFNSLGRRSVSADFKVLIEICCSSSHSYLEDPTDARSFRVRL
jgi:hypothetical protein